MLQKSVWILGICLILGFSVFMLTSQPAYAVRVSLKRVVFDENKRSEILTIINTTAEPQTYRLGWRRYRMSGGKGLSVIKEGEDDSDILWADDMIRFAPRRVTIPPGSSQQIRLLLRRPANIQQAEYRSHLWIVSESKPAKFDAEPGNKKAMRLAVQPAISLPIFVRHGDLNVETSISNAQLKRTDKGLNTTFTLNRTGNRSIYGDFDFTCTNQSEELILHQVRGIAVYTETNMRNLDFDIPLSENTAANCSSIKITYRADPNDADFAGKTLAEATATLQ